jgi:NADH dehydrogenase [ubiquinone] 1 alpha subcomplex assembly factor 7
MNPLTRYLRDEIATHGPITVATFMATAMSHPEHGYYMKRDPLGREGDFITAPEVSQMFGELIGLWCVAGWERMGRPEKLMLVELGPGRGTLMADALRAIATVPACRAALDIHLVEISPPLKAAQVNALDGNLITWHDSLAALPEGPMLLVTNELYDALPIHQFIRTAEGWRERLVDAAPEGFRFVLASQNTPTTALISSAACGAALGSIAEVSAVGVSLTHEIGRRIAASDGLALIIDYASDQGPIGDTLQAVRRHGYHPVLDDPGEADISARVDFTTMARVADEAGAQAFGPVNQGDFLAALGIEARAEILSRNASETQLADIAQAVQRLVGPSEMGCLFKALAIARSGSPPPVGFHD